MKKLHMGTMSYGFDSMDEVAHQLSMAFGAESKFMMKPFNLLLSVSQRQLKFRRVFKWPLGGAVTCLLGSEMRFSAWPCAIM